MKPLLFLALLLLGCTDPNVQPEPTTIPVSPETVQHDSVTPPDSMSIYLLNPVDFYALKKAVGMLNGNAFQVPDSCFHQVTDSTYVHYGYWVTEFYENVNGALPSLSFQTLKPWATPQDRYYDNDNEILTGVKSCVAWECLGPSNFVGATREAILARFSEPNANKNECLVYYRNDRVLVLNMKDDKVAWFQYLWLNDTIGNINQLPEACLVWMK